MMHITPKTIYRLMLLVLLLLAGDTMARGGMSLDDAVKSTRSRTGGRVISAETQNLNGKQVHNIRMLTKDGKVKRIRIDSKSGRQMQGRPARKGR